MMVVDTTLGGAASGRNRDELAHRMGYALV
jgi:hypothetical protein